MCVLVPTGYVSTQNNTAKLCLFGRSRNPVSVELGTADCEKENKTTICCK